MILIGMFDSPFVRRVAISMRLLGFDFDHRNWSIGKDFDRIREYNPLGRVPTLVLDDGEVLIESGALLDHLDELAGPEHALLPADGADRRSALKLIVVATGAAEKGALQVYETAFRPVDKQFSGWTDRCATQMHAALAELDAACAKAAGGFLVGDRITQADVTVTCTFAFVDGALRLDPAMYAALRAHAARFEALPAFAEFRVAHSRPGQP